MASSDFIPAKARPSERTSDTTPTRSIARWGVALRGWATPKGAKNCPRRDMANITLAAAFRHPSMQAKKLRTMPMATIRERWGQPAALEGHDHDIGHDEVQKTDRQDAGEDGARDRLQRMARLLPERGHALEA